jgi:tetratricopeptide (TPR) repeat protein
MQIAISMTSQQVVTLILIIIVFTTFVSVAEPILGILDYNQKSVTSEQESDLSKENLAPTMENAKALLKNCDSYGENNDLARASDCYTKVKDCAENILKEDPSDPTALDLETDAENSRQGLEGKIHRLPPGSKCTCVRNSSYDSIIAGYDEVTRLNPSNAKAWNNRGALLGELCCKTDARDSFDKAIAINSSLAEPWYNKGVSLFQENPREALKCFNRSVELDPGLAEAWFNRYTLLMPSNIDITSRSYMEAMDSYNKSIDLNPDLTFYKPPYLIYKRIE